MRRSKLVTVAAVALAASTVACADDKKPSHVQTCVDKQGTIVEDTKCAEDVKAGQAATAAGHAHVPMFMPYFVPYGSSIGLGSRAYGGSYVAPAGASIASGSSVRSGAFSRGGFGSSARGASSAGAGG